MLKNQQINKKVYVSRYFKFCFLVFGTKICSAHLGDSNYNKLTITVMDDMTRIVIAYRKGKCRFIHLLFNYDDLDFVYLAPPEHF